MLFLLSIVAVLLAVFFAALTWRLMRQERLRSAARVAALSDAIDGVTPSMPDDAVVVQPEFLAHERPATGGGGLLKIAGGFALAVVLIVAFATAGTRHPQAQTSAPAAAKDPALELLSMRHTREGDTLTVTGLLRNGGSKPVDRLIAVVFSFDRSGSFVTSGRAPVEFLTLAPGDETPFKVSVPNAGDVGRYRVSFRTEAGVVRHVDKRQALLADGGSALK